jgi:SAM-dependent methyltransferase
MYLEDLPFWQDLAAQQGGPILELGCGTGRVLLPLQQAGYQMVGLDNDLEMLQFLLRRLPAGSPSRIFLADMAGYRLAQQYPLIIMPCNTLSTLAAEDRLQVFACLRRHLSCGGVFAASLPNPALLRALPARGDEEIEEMLEHPETKGPLQVSSAWRRSKQAFTVTWHYDHLRSDGMVERLSVKAHHSLDGVEVYQAELQQAGLQITALYGDFDRSAYDAESPNLIIVAR